MDSISESLREHYKKTFQKHGATVKGVDWGENEATLHLRYDKMLAVIEKGSAAKPSVLDVGCGFGGLYLYAQMKGIALNYTGIDIVSNMILWARKNIKKAKFIEDDFCDHDFSDMSFDYAVCNGILTQKLDASMMEMDDYAKSLVKKMYGLCKKAIAFNMMTTYVNYYSPNLYYKHPAETLIYCLSELSKKVKIDHSYVLYEFTTYVYK